MAFPTIDNLTFDAEARRALPHPPSGGVLTPIKSELTIPTAALSTGAVSRVLWVPAGFQLWGMACKIGDLDTSTALVWDLGWRSSESTTEDDQNGIVAGSSVGQSAGALNTDDMALAGVGYTFLYDSDIVFTATTGSGGAQAAACKFALFGTMP